MISPILSYPTATETITCPIATETTTYRSIPTTFLLPVHQQQKHLPIQQQQLPI